MASLDRPPPSTAAIAAAAAIVSFLLGYYIGQARSIGLFRPESKSTPSAADLRHKEHPSPALSSDDAHSSDDELGELNTFPGHEECKLVLVVRTDLGMTKGKIAAQCSHATLACYKALMRADAAHPLLRRWERLGQAKVALKVDGGEDDLLVLQAQALSLGICAQIIHDAGRTQIASGSATVLGIGPAPKSKIDEVTGHLKLL
ncbi:peptidyl-tRNA hydrolase PTH2-domain-containing protein [Neohortaea acidophila]|uniref:peptidyl-tRNA hydrolase n=1 Tax=Neohortaea acidophila TaxID=245834 RepID=A0A6A6PGH3_9PEZI|nr:peptidyl-tRNA hydrolase PTH2-domain-containing protein [Neohortaea acidophila]KAF2479088.1 peptidyl-tRNA hydrolase PTH2-domain-containing protein [Neohortaea acidophila]